MLVKKIDFSKYSSVKIVNIFEVEVLSGNFGFFDGVIIGGANNILISPNPPKLGILDKEFDYIKFNEFGDENLGEKISDSKILSDKNLNGKILEIGALTKSAKIYNFSKKFNLSGFEFLKGIPGTLGGLLTMNAGLLGHEISKNLISVTTNLGEFKKDELNFSYRKSDIKGVIKSAKFKVLKGFDENLSLEISKKRANQPRGNSFGSCFKNPVGLSAGKLIDECGLKGYKIGNCGFSQEHANFLINYGGGTFDEVLSLINLAKKRVFENFGINLETEVVILWKR